jgi:hypothetical protein
MPFSLLSSLFLSMLTFLFLASSLQWVSPPKPVPVPLRSSPPSPTTPPSLARSRLVLPSSRLITPCPPIACFSPPHPSHFAWVFCPPSCFVSHLYCCYPPPFLSLSGRIASSSLIFFPCFAFDLHVHSSNDSREVMRLACRTEQVEVPLTRKTLAGRCSTR